MTELSPLDLGGMLLAALLTLMVLSYLLGDNPLFHTAIHLFVGVTAGYAGAIALRNVLKPMLIDSLFAGGALSLSPILIISWLLVLMLLLKGLRSTAAWGSLPVALLVGVGAALVVGGAVTGTLVPQTLAAMDTLDPAAVAPLTGETSFERVANVLILMTGTISTLLYFRFTVRRAPTGEATQPRWMVLVSYVGRLFIALTFGVMFAGALSAAIAVLADRMRFLLGLFSGLAGG